VGQYVVWKQATSLPIACMSAGSEALDGEPVWECGVREIIVIRSGRTRRPLPERESVAIGGV